jgi:dipeptidyl aminopeptidase/acylaminoacyl peptidase
MLKILKIKFYYLFFIIIILFTPLRAQEIALTSDLYNHWYPEWSFADPTKIVYQKNDATGWWHIYIVASGGGAETGLTSDNNEHIHPQWSPDGNWIVYHKWDMTGYEQIYKVSSTGITEQKTTKPLCYILEVKPTISLSGMVKINYSILKREQVTLT